MIKRKQQHDSLQSSVQDTLLYVNDPRRRCTNAFQALNVACFLAQVATRGNFTHWGAKVPSPHARPAGVSPPLACPAGAALCTLSTCVVLVRASSRRVGVRGRR